MTNAIKTKLAAALIALSLCPVWFLFSRAVAAGDQHSTQTPAVFSADSHLVEHYDYDKLPVVFKPRVGGLWIAGRLLDAFSDGGRITATAFRNAFGAYNAGWLFLIFVMLICLADNPVFVIPFVFAGMCCSFNSPGIATFYAWDLPAMFFFTLSCLLWERGKYIWMLAVILLGTVFKETIAVTALAFFFTRLGWKRRLVFFGVAFCGCFLIKLWISYAVLGHVQIFTQDLNAETPDKFFILKSNLTHVFSLSWGNPLLANAGSLALVLCLPMRTLIDRGIKCVIGAFLIGQLFAGNFPEFRIFMEVLPVSALYLSRTVQNWNTGNVKPNKLPATQNEPCFTAVNDFAWFLATSHQATNRNGALAIELAEYVCEQTHYREAILVGTLAAAYAEAGRFKEAISTAQKACDLAAKSGQAELLKRNQELLRLYRAHKAYREAAEPAHKQATQ